MSYTTCTRNVDDHYFSNEKHCSDYCGSFVATLRAYIAVGWCSLSCCQRGAKTDKRRMNTLEGRNEIKGLDKINVAVLIVMEYYKNNITTGQPKLSYVLIKRWTEGEKQTEKLKNL